ncbi:PRC-barrel domain-containing protein [Dermatophilaceae bacterium Soc4.6]
MLFSVAKGHKVVSTDTAEQVGKIKDVVVDPATHSVVALLLKKADNGSILKWSDLTGFGSDAATVTSAALVVEADDQVDALRGKDHEVLGKRVLDTRGDDLGTVKDLDIDPTTGAITSIVLERRSVPGPMLVGVGSYAVVVAHATTS